MAFDGVVEMLCKRVVDDADEGDEVVGEGEGDGYVREGVDEVGGAVDGVADECRSRGQEGGGRCGG